MKKAERPYNTVITLIGDTFEEGEKPVEKVIDLTEVSDSELETLSKTFNEAFYEILWRNLHNSGK